MCSAIPRPSGRHTRGCCVSAAFGSTGISFTASRPKRCGVESGLTILLSDRQPPALACSNTSHRRSAPALTWTPRDQDKLDRGAALPQLDERGVLWVTVPRPGVLHGRELEHDHHAGKWRGPFKCFHLPCTDQIPPTVLLQQGLDLRTIPRLCAFFVTSCFGPVFSAFTYPDCP